MSNKIANLCMSLLLLAATPAIVLAAEEGKGTSPTRLDNVILSGDEELPVSAVHSSYSGISRSPGTQIGDTYYDIQENGSIGRRIVCTYEAPHDRYSGVHFVWTCLPCMGGSRHVRYNALSSDGTWAHFIGPNGGVSVSDANGGYSSVDVTHAGNAVIGYHSGPTFPTNTTKACLDTDPPNAAFACGENPGPPNCEGWETGNYEATSVYGYAKVEVDVYGTDTIFHKVTTEAPPSGASNIEKRTVVYDKCVWDPVGQQPVCPSCAMAVDSVQTISAVVRQDPMSDEVAIVWMHPIHYEGDPNDPCGDIQWQNDVYVWKSSDCGDTWNRGEIMNITDYTQGGTIPIDQVPGLAYCDLSALYDHNGDLHVVWNTPLRDGCTIYLASKIWHWSDTSPITVVYDASSPTVFYPIGSWNVSTAKMNLSECDGRLYCSFTRFGFHSVGDESQDASYNGHENGDIGLVASTDLTGLFWSEAVNVTNTNTDDCLPGLCESEHWSTMAKYSNDSVHIQYIEDKDPGAWPQGEGDQTCNPVRYIRYDCFTPETYCEVSYSPDSVENLPFVAPQYHEGCLWDDTTTFDLILTNSGNEATSYTVSSDIVWLTPSDVSGTLPAGFDNVDTIPYTIGPVDLEGVYCGNLTITACDGATVETVPVCIRVCCVCYEPEYAILSTACWSIGIWNNARAGLGPLNEEGNMYWLMDGVPLMYDESIIITNADDITQTWFSIYDGSLLGDPLDALSQVIVTDTLPNYIHSYSAWATPESTFVGHFECFLPTHQDTCCMIERFSICNYTETPMTIHVGDAIDWDIPDGEGGSNNQAGVDFDRQMVYQYGPPGTPEENFYGGVSVVGDIVGAIVLENDEWVYPNEGYVPAEIGALLQTHTGFVTPSTVEDLNSVYVIDRDVLLEPGQCAVYAKVKASSLTGLAYLQEQIDKGKAWIAAYDEPLEAIKLDRQTARFYHNQDNYLPPDGMAGSILGTVWHELYPTFCTNWTVLVDFDNGDGILSAGDMLIIGDGAAGYRFEYVNRVTTTLKAQAWLVGGDTYLDLRFPLNPLNSPMPFWTGLPLTWWQEINPVLSQWWRVFPVYDNAPSPPDGIVSPVDFVIGWRFFPAATPPAIWLYTVQPDWPLVTTPAFPRNVPATDIQSRPLIIGDADGNGSIDIDDAVYLVAYIFMGGPPPIPHPVASGDANCHCDVDIDDAVWLIGYIFQGGPPPCEDYEWLDWCPQLWEVELEKGAD